MRKITADLLFSMHANDEPLCETVLLVADDGRIEGLAPLREFELSAVEQYRGALVPGFVNAHCHLELSHMRGLVPTGTGLLPFIANVVQRRGAQSELIEAAIAAADAEMYAAGIVAVGDISNAPDSFFTKINSKIAYYTFVEFFDFMQKERAGDTFFQYKNVLDALPSNLKSAVPHAPYSVSEDLFALINGLNNTLGGQRTVSIHNQETPPENELFMHGTGDFLGFYQKFAFPIPSFLPTKNTAIHYALKNLDPRQRTLFVHNTLTSAADIAAAQAWNAQTWWATCPNANLYIENRLPNYAHFKAAGAQMCIGTDSYTSNWQLNIWAEVQTILRHQSYLTVGEVLGWATRNGAEALGLSDNLGTFERGKTPGVVLLEGFSLTDIGSTKARRLV